MAHYGFIGVGIMGSAMASNLLAAGHDVTVWNRNAERCIPLVERGAVAATTPAEVVRASEVTFSMVSDPAATLDVVFGGGGMLEAVCPGHDYVETSTIDANTSSSVADAVAALGARYLEAPVTGTKKPAEDGQLVFLCAGDETLYSDAQPALNAMGKMAVYLGEVGNAARMKLIINAMMGSVMAALSEGISLAEASGLDGEQLLELVDVGVIGCPLVRAKGPQVLTRNYPTSFPLKHQQKDLRLAIALAEEVGLALPTFTAVNALFEAAVSDGRGDQDMSAVAETVRLT